jgi:hypothetical protein
MIKSFQIYQVQVFHTSASYRIINYHLGDLSEVGAYQGLRRGIQYFLDLFQNLRCQFRDDFKRLEILKNLFWFGRPQDHGGCVGILRYPR